MQAKSTPKNIEINRQLAVWLCLLTLILGLLIGWGVSIFVGELRKSDTETSDSYSLTASSPSDSNSYYDAKYLEEIFKIIDSKYIDDIPTNVDKNTYGLVKGFVESLGDKYTNFYDPEEAERYLSQSTGDFEGIGVVLSYSGEYTYIETVLKGNPAESAGIQTGDILLEVDGADVSKKQPSEIALLIRGEKNTDVDLKVARVADGKSDKVDFTITRNFIDIDNVTWEKVDDKTAIVTISQFSDESSSAFNKVWDKVVEEVKKEYGNNLENVIVDLRNNPGGYVYSVQYVAEEFLTKDQIIMQERLNTGKVTTYTDKRVGYFEGKKVVVLVNEGSASASEIFSAAIQENDLGEVVGMPTVGKGVEQEMIRLKDGSIFLVVFQEWLTPDGNKISTEEPIKPDFEVDYTIEDFQAKKDPQLDKAKELVK